MNSFFNFIISSMVNGESVVLKLINQLGLEIAELLFQNVGSHQYNVFRFKGSARFNGVVKFVGLARKIVRGLKI